MTEDNTLNDPSRNWIKLGFKKKPTSQQKQRVLHELAMSICSYTDLHSKVAEVSIYVFVATRKMLLS